MNATPITPVTTIPSVAPGDATLTGKVFRLDGGNAVEIFGACSANSGKLYLLRNDVGTEWYPVDIDAQDLKALQVDTTKPAGALAGLFSGTWLTGDKTPANYVVLHVGTATFATLYAAGRRI